MNCTPLLKYKLQTLGGWLRITHKIFIYLSRFYHTTTLDNFTCASYCAWYVAPKIENKKYVFLLSKKYIHAEGSVCIVSIFILREVRRYKKYIFLYVLYWGILRVSHYLCHEISYLFRLVVIALRAFPTI